MKSRSTHVEYVAMSLALGRGGGRRALRALLPFLGLVTPGIAAGARAVPGRTGAGSMPWGEPWGWSQAGTHTLAPDATLQRGVPPESGTAPAGLPAAATAAAPAPRQEEALPAALPVLMWGGRPQAPAGSDEGRGGWQPLLGPGANRPPATRTAHAVAGGAARPQQRTAASQPTAAARQTPMPWQPAGTRGGSPAAGHVPPVAAHASEPAADAPGLPQRAAGPGVPPTAHVEPAAPGAEATRQVPGSAPAATLPPMPAPAVPPASRGVPAAWAPLPPLALDAVQARPGVWQRAGVPAGPAHAGADAVRGRDRQTAGMGAQPAGTVELPWAGAAPPQPVPSAPPGAAAAPPPGPYASTAARELAAVADAVRTIERVLDRRVEVEVTRQQKTIQAQVAQRLDEERREVAAEMVSDDVVRALMQKMNSLAREEQFRLGRPR